MHLIDRKWTDLAAGYQAVQSLQARLETEFGRAVQVGHKQKFRKEVTEWQKKRRIFFALVVIAPLSIIVLCLAAFYFREVACVIIYWVVVVLTILVTLAVAGRSYIRDVINRPKLEDLNAPAADLEQRWWARLSPQELAISTGRGKDKVDFLRLLADSLPEPCLAKRDLLVEGDNHVLLFTPSGLWLFTVRDWGGSIVRQDGIWKQVHNRSEAVIYDQAPDDEWLRQKEAIVKVLEKRLPQRTWTGSSIQGGVAFTHPKVHLDKARIQGNTAAYGPVNAWVGRVRHAPGIDGFPLEMQLEILDALGTAENPKMEQSAHHISSKDEAERLYLEASGELRESVAKMVE
jgi:hypothetical protein